MQGAKTWWTLQGGGAGWATGRGEFQTESRNKTERGAL
jgi:hypothetical protein